MKKPLIIFLLISLTACVNKKQISRDPGQTIKVLSYNVKNCLGMDGKTDYKRVAEVISRINPDVVALQELDSATRRSNGVFVLDELAKLTGMQRVYGASIDYQGGKYGIGILSREKPIKWKRVPLPGREEKRSLLLVEFGDYIFGSTHFSLTEADRIASAAILNNACNEFKKPVIVAGDFNAAPSSSVIRKMTENWIVLNDTAMFTSPSEKPRRCIDYIFGYKSPAAEYKTRRALVVQERVASDHLPVWVEISLH
jgi:endonuclease/exonuclease/phosphatase family metal-dependent hydrolase